MNKYTLEALRVMIPTEINEGTQKSRILKYMIEHEGQIEVWRLITPRPMGLGVAQYNARIKELRTILARYGFSIENEIGIKFYIKENE